MENKEYNVDTSKLISTESELHGINVTSTPNTSKTRSTIYFNEKVQNTNSSSENSSDCEDSLHGNINAVDPSVLKIMTDLANSPRSNLSTDVIFSESSCSTLDSMDFNDSITKHISPNLQNSDIQQKNVEYGSDTSTFYLGNESETDHSSFSSTHEGSGLESQLYHLSDNSIRNGSQNYQINESDLDIEKHETNLINISDKSTAKSSPEASVTEIINLCDTIEDSKNLTINHSAKTSSINSCEVCKDGEHSDLIIVNNEEPDVIVINDSDESTHNFSTSLSRVNQSDSLCKDSEDVRKSAREEPLKSSTDELIKDKTPPSKNVDDSQIVRNVPRFHCLSCGVNFPIYDFWLRGTQKINYFCSECYSSFKLVVENGEIQSYRLLTLKDKPIEGLDDDSL